MQPQWETIRQFLKTLNAELPYDPAIPSQVYTEKQNKNTNSKRCMLIRALFTTAKIGKQPKCPSTEEWTKKMFYMCSVLSNLAVSNSVTLWTVVHQAPLSMGILQARIVEWVALTSFRGSSQPCDGTQVSCIAGRFFTV